VISIKDKEPSNRSDPEEASGKNGCSVSRPLARTSRAEFKWAGLIIREDDDKSGTGTFDPTNPEHERLVLKHARPKRQRQIPKVAMRPEAA
jgi:hypothetical protein